jgi:glutamate dehydrogenase/leucine dehydrogenase
MKRMKRQMIRRYIAINKGKEEIYHFYRHCLSFDFGKNGQLMRFIIDEYKKIKEEEFREMVQSKRFRNRMKAFKLIYRSANVKK